MKPSAFNVGDRVYDKRDQAKSPGTCVQLVRHTNGSPKWLVHWERENMRVWTWEVDLRPLEAEHAAHG